MGQVGVRRGLILECHRNRRRKTIIDHAPRTRDGNAAPELQRPRYLSQELPSTSRDLFLGFPRRFVRPEYNDMGDHDRRLHHIEPKWQQRPCH